MQLGQRESLRKKLAELEERLGPSALGRVLDELEKALAAMSAETEPQASPGRPFGETRGEPAAETPPASRSADMPDVQITDPALKDPFADLLANLHLSAADPLAGKPPISLAPSIGEGPEKKERPLPPPAKSESREAPPAEKKPVVVEPLRQGGETSRAGGVVAPVSVPAPKPSEPPGAEGSAKKAEKEEPAEPQRVTSVPPPGREMKASAPAVPPPVVVRKSEPPEAKPPEGPPAPAGAKAKPDMSAFLPKPVLVRSAYPLDTEDILYLHAVAQIPLEEKAALEPFILEEKGIEAKEFVFALDRGGLRFYLSRLTGKTTNVSKTGMLLLNRKESIHLRGTHYSILNDLRIHGLLLPFEFGTVAMGLDDLHTRIDEHVYELRDALEEIVATRWWEVCVYGLDMKMMQFVAPDASTSRRGDRNGRQGERSATAGSRIDIKTLERILNKQKAIAEEIHHQLEGLAERSDVDMMVNLSSGSSDDWKPILRASYEVGSPEIYRFNHAITDMQYHHLKYQLMFVLTGDREDFSFQQG